jgi:hypothetical protein
MTPEPTPEAVGTPEGDNEILPDEPLQPSTDEALTDLQKPPGSKPSDYERDKK